MLTGSKYLARISRDIYIYIYIIYIYIYIYIYLFTKKILCIECVRTVCHSFAHPGLRKNSQALELFGVLQSVTVSF